MSIQWGKQAWDDVKAETVIKCFTKVGLCPRTLPEGKDDDPFAGKEIGDVQDLVLLLKNTSATRMVFLHVISRLTQQVKTGERKFEMKYWVKKIRHRKSRTILTVRILKKKLSTKTN